MHLPVWALAIGFALAEHLVVHVHFRRSSHSMSLGEIPLVFALLYSGGWTIVIAYTVGRACALVILRLPAVRLVFNAAEFALGGCLAVITFHAIGGSASTSDPRIWLAAAAAATAASACAVLMITVAVSLSEGRLTLDRVFSSMRTDLTVDARQHVARAVRRAAGGERLADGRSARGAGARDVRHDARLRSPARAPRPA